MAQMQQKLINNQLQAASSHEEIKIPSYYKTSAVNPALFAEQQRKRKLLWSKPKDSNEITSTKLVGQAIVETTQDERTAEKFRKLMGIDKQELASNKSPSTSATESLNSMQKKAFEDLDKEYADDQADGGAALDTAAAGGNIAAVAADSADYDGIPATGIITIWKRDTAVNSYFLTADKETAADGATTALVLGANHGSDLAVDTAATGKILLVGGSEFVSATGYTAATGTIAVSNNPAAVTDTPGGGGKATSALPFVAQNEKSHHTGDSVVQYTCGWTTVNTFDAATDQWRTLAGIAKRKNRCLTTSLIGLPVIPLASTTGIKPGDFLRIDFPKMNTGAGQADGLVVDADEEIYLVNAINDGDVVVTAKPLADDGNHAANVNRYPGGTAIDLLSRTGISLSYTTTANAQIKGTDAFTFTATSTLDNIAVGQYCLIDSEFMMINSIVGTTVGFAARTVHAATLRGNRGRGAFGTDNTDTNQARVNGGSNYDSLKVAKCLVI